MVGAIVFATIASVFSQWLSSLLNYVPLQNKHHSYVKKIPLANHISALGNFIWQAPFQQLHAWKIPLARGFAEDNMGFGGTPSINVIPGKS